jgi:hypothetical protein
MALYATLLHEHRQVYTWVELSTRSATIELILTGSCN